MAHFYDLFHRRPDVVCKLSRFDDNTYVLAKSAHSIGGSDDIILSDGAIEYALWTEFSEKALRQIEYTAFVLRGYVLSPKKCMLVVRKFFHQSACDSLTQFLAVARCISH